MSSAAAHRQQPYYEHVATLLLPGEKPLGSFKASLDPLTPIAVPRRHRPRREKRPKGEDRSFRGIGSVLVPLYWIAAGLSFLISPVVITVGRLEDWMWRGFGIRRLFRGRVWQGGWESDAGRFIIAVRGRGESESCLLAATDRRMLILERPYSPELEEAKLRGEFARGTYGLRSEPHPARHKDRVDIAFADGSWLAVDIADRAQVPELERYLSGLTA